MGMSLERGKKGARYVEIAKAHRGNVCHCLMQRGITTHDQEDL